MWSDPDDVDNWAVSPRGAGWLFGGMVTREVRSSSFAHFIFLHLAFFSLSLQDPVFLIRHLTEPSNSALTFHSVIMTMSDQTIALSLTTLIL
jgi:hypothetical protein